MAYRGGPEGPAAADQQTFKAVDYQQTKHASEPSRRGLEVANSYRSTANALEENTIIRVVRENFKELNCRHGEEQDKLLQHIAWLEEELASKNLELSRGVPVPYGSYCSSGATPQLLVVYSEKILIDLDNFVSFSIPSETSIEIANSLKALVSDVFFSKFEQINFGVKGEFIVPGLLPEQSLTEFRAFDADDPEGEAVKPYMPKYRRYFAYKLAKIQKTCGQVKFNEASYAHFCNLAMNVWMLHKLTFSFKRANVRLMRVVRDEPFIDKFMEPVGQQDEDQLIGKPRATTTTVKHVIFPGLWINDSVIKCRVCLGSETSQELSNALAAQLRGGDAVNGTGPRNVDVTPKQAHQSTSSQVPDRQAPAAHTHAHQQTQATEYIVTDEPHVSEASHIRLSDEELGNDETPAAEEDQSAQEMTNMDNTNSPVEELEEKPPLQPPHPLTVTDNYHPPSSTHIAHHGKGLNPHHGSACQSHHSGGWKSWW